MSTEQALDSEIAAGLSRVRNRLLDLTARNRLLNFRHPRRSSVRIVNDGRPPFGLRFCPGYQTRSSPRCLKERP